MTDIKHLTQNQLIAYHNGSLEKHESHNIGKHLLMCAECRKMLPLPSVERFWSAIMTDTEIIAALAKEEAKFSFVSILSAFSSFLKLQSGLLWGGAALIIIFSFSVLLWLNVADSSREVVQTFDNELNSKLNFPLPTETPTNGDTTFSMNSNRTVVNPTPKLSKTEVPKQKTVQNNSRQDFNKADLKQQKENISATRGISTKCSENKTIEVEFSADKESLVFKWKAVPKATKYHLYISDDEEILIDEYETEAETTFVLKKPLNPLKTYKWKIIVTLENGQQVVGDSQKFTMKDFQTNQKKIETKRSSETRCSANNG